MLDSLAKFLATGFFSGMSPKVPGTVGSAVALAIYCLIGYFFHDSAGMIIFLVFIIGVVPAVIVCDMAEKIYGEKDPQRVVIDEFFGLWLGFVLLPFSWNAAFIGFVLFRFFDILKPFPINTLQNIKGGIGIMIDDLLAGVYVRIIMFLIFHFRDTIPFTVF